MMLPLTFPPSHPLIFSSGLHTSKVDTDSLAVNLMNTVRTNQTKQCSENTMAAYGRASLTGVVVVVRTGG